MQPQGLEQGCPEGFTQKEVDERVQNRVQGREEERTFLQLKEEEFELAVKQSASGLTQGVRHTGKVERHKTHKEHCENEEYIYIHFSFSLMG